MPLPQPLEARWRALVTGAAAFAILFTLALIVIRLRGPNFLLLYVDIPLHLLGGFIAAATFVFFLQFTLTAVTIRSLPRPFAVVSVLGFVALVTIAWEGFEYFTDHFGLTQVQLSIFYTLKDMLVGLTGAAFIALAWPTRRSWHTETEQGAAANP